MLPWVLRTTHPKRWAAKEAGLGEAVGIRDTGGSGPTHLARSPDPVLSGWPRPWRVAGSGQV